MTIKYICDKCDLTSPDEVPDLNLYKHKINDRYVDLCLDCVKRYEKIEQRFHKKLHDKLERWLVGEDDDAGA